MCGIFGCIGEHDVKQELLDGIALLQHRGQEAAGILLIDTARGTHSCVKALGNLSNLPSGPLSAMKGTVGISHLRYTTTGGNCLENTQPFWTDEANAGLAHNGQLQNMLELQSILQRKKKQLYSTSDGELLLRIFAMHLEEVIARHDPALDYEDCLFLAVLATQKSAVGGYSCILPIREAGLLAFRDQYGIRPLVMGRKKGVVAFASESVALELNGYVDITNVEHGEAILVRPDLSMHRQVLDQRQRSNCGFEYFYFANSASVLEDSSVNDVRYEMGKLLARRCVENGVLSRVDIVTPVPETPRPAAGGFCEASGKPYKDIIYKSRYVKRIFITPDQEAREKKAEQGFRYDKKAFRGKRVMLIDDSIVRGTNMHEIVKRVRGFGASEVHIGVTWPAIVSSCPYGIDMPDLLVAKGRTLSEIQSYLGADTVTYMTPQDVFLVLGRKDLCMGCVTGNYPTGSGDIKK